MVTTWMTPARFGTAAAAVIPGLSSTKDNCSGERTASGNGTYGRSLDKCTYTSTWPIFVPFKVKVWRTR